MGTVQVSGRSAWSDAGNGRVQPNAGAVVDRLGIPGFLVGAEIAAGVPVLRAVGAKDGKMLLALKSGNFGGPEFFSDALRLMR